MRRREWLGWSLAAVGGVFVPRWGRWFLRERPHEAVKYATWVWAPQDADTFLWPVGAYGLTVKAFTVEGVVVEWQPVDREPMPSRLHVLHG